MASIKQRPRKNGITYVVRWRADGGARGSKEDTETFNSEPEALVFKALVDAAGQRWPTGWVRGQGFAAKEPPPDAQPTMADMLFTDWGTRVIDRLTGIDDRTRHDYHREMRLHGSLIVHTDDDGNTTPATVANVTQDDMTDWVRAEEDGLAHPDVEDKWLRRPAKPKSIQNRHGLISQIFQAAIDRAEPLRATNPCAKTRLPDTEGSDEDMTFLERDEYQRIRIELEQLHGGDGVVIADMLVGTGMRWGELTALRVRDLNLSAGTLRVQRAWKRQPNGSYKIGSPKTKKSRRTISLSTPLVSMLRKTIAGRGPDDLVFQTKSGKTWSTAHFYTRRWVKAVEAAQAKGLTKRPRVHDLRHTHVAWLIAKKIPLPAIQARLGHETITTTVDRYGHLLRELDDEINAAVAESMAFAAPVGLQMVDSAAREA